MVQKKLRKSESTLVKSYCSRLSDEDLLSISTLLPQTIAFDRANACDILQKDKEIDKWLSQAADADDWFSRADSVGDAALEEIDSRSKKSSK